MTCDSCDPNGHYGQEEEKERLFNSYMEARNLLEFIFSNVPATSQQEATDLATTLDRLKNTVGKKYSKVSK